MFWGIHEFVQFLYGLEEETWVQLWAGVFGAVPAAVISAAVAAWVAVTVLNRSNAHQRVLASEGMAQQKELAGRQLAEQRNEAKRVREQAVMADLLGAANGFDRASAAGVDAVEAQLHEFHNFAHRWEFEASEPSHLLELWKWGLVFWKPAYHLALVTDAPKGTRSAWKAFMQDAKGSFTGVAITLGQAETSQRKEFLDFVARQREKLNARWDEEMSTLPRSAEDAAPS